jgi:hypothetical protein
MFKEGDRVKIVAENSGEHKELIGSSVIISQVSSGSYRLRDVPHSYGWWQENELTKLENNMSKKYYQVKQDTPIWFAGAILEYDESTSSYTATNDLFDKIEEGVNGECLTAHIVENEANKDFFERVYEASKLGKTIYVTKAKARELANTFFKPDEAKTAKETKKAAKKA